MKKILLVILAFIATLASESLFAISYEGSSLRHYPLTVSSGSWNFDNTSPWVASSGCLGDLNTLFHPYLFCSNDSSTQKRASYGYFTEIDFNTLTLNQYKPIENIYSSNGSSADARVQIFLNKNSTGSYNIQLQVFDSAGATLVDGTIGTISTGSSFGSGSLPQRFVFYLGSEISEIQDAPNSWNYYLREVNFCMYINEVASNVCFTKSYLSPTFPNGLLMRNSATDLSIYPVQFSGITGSVYNIVYTPVPGTSLTPGLKQKWIDFTTGTGAGTMTQWLGGLSAYYVVGGITNTGSTSTGSSSSGSIFTSCSTFDIACYFGNSITYLSDTISGFGQSLFNYFIPDISFTGNASTCMGGSGSLSASGGLGYSQKLVNLFVVAVPIAPPDDSLVCTLDGQKTIDYGPSSASFIDIILIFVCVLPIFFAIPHKKPL